MTTNSTQGNWDVIVIGGGVAGLSAALMLGRANRRVLVVDQGKPRNRFADHMYGVLGHDGKDPLQLLAIGRDEVARYDIPVVDGEVEQVSDGPEGLQVTIAGGTTERTRSVILATGVHDELPDIPGLAERWGKTVLHCPYCHGWEVRGRRFGVLATGPMSLHQAQLVRQWSDRVTLFSAAAGPLDAELEKRLRARDIEIVESPVVEVQGEGASITGVRTADGAITELDVIFTGGVLQPRDAFLDGNGLAGLGLERSDSPVGNLLRTDEVGRTSHPWIRAVGNLTSPMGNVTSAMNSGSMAGALLNMDLVTADFDAALSS